MNTQANMPEQSLLNGLPPQFGKPNIMPTPVPFNGIDSSHSSRTTSPANRLHQIPASQLPPSRSGIPTSQLPPSGMKPGNNINQITQNYANLSVSHLTPISSPVIHPANTSTPLSTRNETSSAGISPIRVQNTFTHSTQSQFTNTQQGNVSYINGQPQSNAKQIQSAPSKQGDSNNLNTQKLFNQVDKPGMHQSLSQPLLEIPPYRNPAATTLPNQISRAPPNFGSTPNMFQATQFKQNIPPNAATNLSNNSTESMFQPTQFKQNMPPNAATNLSNNSTESMFQATQFKQNMPPNAATNLSSNSTESMFQATQFKQNMPPNATTNLSSNSTEKLFNNAQPNRTIGGNLQQRPTFPPMGMQPLQTNPNALSQVPLQPTLPPQPIPPPLSSTNQAPPKTNFHSNRYPQAPQFQNNLLPPQHQNFAGPQVQQNSFQNQRAFSGGVVQSGFNKMWGHENYDLLQCPNILPPITIEAPRVSLGQDYLDAANCSPDIFRCTMTKIPETNSLLQKSRLPLGILIHPFKDLDHLPVIQCSTIVRCRACRTYINPFVFFVDMKRWKCNLCYRVNELPEEFQFDPVSKTYGDPSRRPEIKSSTIEYIAPSEYMLRPPQPAVYLFLLDISHAAIESGYLHTFCNVLTSTLSDLPGDARTQVGFIAYNSALHFYSLAEGLNQPHEMIVLDIDEIFLPCPDNLVVNLLERKELIIDLLAQLPTRFVDSHDTGSALGAALQAAHKMIGGTGGRITVFQATLPTIGPGALTVREDPNQRAGNEINHLNPANDFYKRLALECSGQQIAVDLFIINSQYVDLATISGISRFSGGCMYHFPLFKASRILQVEHLERSLKRYLTRKIGFEAVMRIRCTRGLSIHTFHGNFFVRSTDLLSLPNVNPEAGFGMQVSIDESLSDLHTVCFQVALLYTSSKGERRIRVHTLCVPIATTLPDVLGSADQQCIVGLLAKMAVDRSMQSSLADAREAFLNVAIDILSSYKLSLNLGGGEGIGLQVSNHLKLLPLYISALLKYTPFRTGTSTRLDDRVKAMCDMKTLPLYLLIQQIYPDLYPIHNLEEQNTVLNVDGESIPQPPHLQLTARSLDSKSAFLMDMGEHMVIFVGPSVSDVFLNEALGVPNYNAISDQMYGLPILDTLHNQRLNNFINYLNDQKPFVATLQIIRENSPNRSVFIERLIEDRIETALSYHEFLQHLKTQVK